MKHRVKKFWTKHEDNLADFVGGMIVTSILLGGFCYLADGTRVNGAREYVNDETGEKLIVVSQKNGFKTPLRQLPKKN